MGLKYCMMHYFQSFPVNKVPSQWLSVRLRTKWLCVRIPLLSLKLQIMYLFHARSSLTFGQTIEYRFSLKLARDMIITCSQYLPCFI